MNNSNYSFIANVSSIFKNLTQFSQEVCDFIACQFALESSFGESALAHANNNYCGMKNPLVRISSALHAGDGNYHWAQYVSLQDCILDYLLCLQYHRPLSTDYDSVVHFSRFISKFYCPERNYINKINLIYQQFKSFKS